MGQRETVEKADAILDTASRAGMDPAAAAQYLRDCMFQEEEEPKEHWFDFTLKLALLITLVYVWLEALHEGATPDAPIRVITDLLF
jgi:hypothetical protein